VATQTPSVGGKVGGRVGGKVGGGVVQIPHDNGQRWGMPAVEHDIPGDVNGP